MLVSSEECGQSIVVLPLENAKTQRTRWVIQIAVLHKKPAFVPWVAIAWNRTPNHNEEEEAEELAARPRGMNPTTNPTESKGEAGASTNGPANNPPEIGAQSYEDRNGQHHPIAEFLYQLTKMLTDDNNEIIEWADGKIKVHHPERLEGEVLHKYFRHSKFARYVCFVVVFWFSFW